MAHDPSGQRICLACLFLTCWQRFGSLLLLESMLTAATEEGERPEPLTAGQAISRASCHAECCSHRAWPTVTESRGANQYCVA